MAEMETAPEEVRLLFIEDDPVVADMYRLKLELDGYTVKVVPDGESGLREARENPPDLIFLDIRLPGMDGLAVLEQIRGRQETKHLPVVILSNYGEDELIQRGLHLGALEYLIKSQTTPSELSNNVESWSQGGVPEGA
jgi:CheY-like chemotaxis protein